MVSAVPAHRQDGPFDLPGEVLASLAAGGIGPADDDIVVVLSKCVSCSQGRLVDIGGAVVSEAAACVQVLGKPSPVQARPALVGPHSR